MLEIKKKGLGGGERRGEGRLGGRGGKIEVRRVQEWIKITQMPRGSKKELTCHRWIYGQSALCGPFDLFEDLFLGRTRGRLFFRRFCATPTFCSVGT